MSWALSLTGDARLDVSRLEVTLQEAVFDRLELLLEGAVERGWRPDTSDLYAELDGVTHRLKLYLAYRQASRTLILLDVDHEQSPL